MGYTPRYDRGDWNAICDACGRKLKASALRQRWDGLKVCDLDWEPRQPQDFVRGVADYQAPPFTRPEQQNQFIAIHYTQYPSIALTSLATLIAGAIRAKNLVTVPLTNVVSVNTIKTLATTAPRVLNGIQLNKSTIG